jgi:hypothetical protein
MKIDYLPQALEALEGAPAQVRKAFFKPRAPDSKSDARFR